MRALIPLAIGALLFSMSPAFAQGDSKPIGYQIEEQEYEGYLVRPDRPADEKLPAVLVVHDWTGHNAFARIQAEMLAKLGYVGFAVDLYGKDRKAAGPDEAKEMAAPFYEDRNLFRSRMTAALDVLREQPGVDPERLGAIGFCFGGTAVLELARGGAEIAGVVSFHGGLKPGEPADASAVRCDVLVLHGNADPHVPPADVADFMREMNAAKVHYKFVGYPNVVHSFTNPEAGDDPSKGSAYSPETAKAAFSEMRRFFAERFHPAVSLPEDTAALGR